MNQIVKSHEELQETTAEAIEGLANNNEKLINQQGELLNIANTHR